MAAWVYCAIMWPLSTPGSSARNGGRPWLRVPVEEPVGAPLADRGEVGHRDREEVQHVADRRAVEVAVGLHPAVGHDDRVVDRAGQLAVGDRRRVGPGVPHRAVDLRASSAASRRPGPGCSRARGGWRRRRSRRGCRRRLAADAAWPGCGRSAWRSSAKTRSVPSWASTDIAAATSATCEQVAEVVQRRAASMPSMPSVPLISASPSLAASSTGSQPGLGERGRGVGERAVGPAYRPLAHERQRAVRQRREVAGAAERAVLVDDRGDAVR